ncbi:unnamed protein product, partial [Brachionus calyciflorus]
MKDTHLTKRIYRSILLVLSIFIISILFQLKVTLLDIILLLIISELCLILIREFNNSKSCSTNSLFKSKRKFSQVQTRRNFTNTKPVSNFTNKKPESNVINTKPESNLTNKKPESNFTNTKPESNFTNKKPESNVINAKPESNLTSKKPESNFITNRKELTFTNVFIDVFDSYNEIIRKKYSFSDIQSYMKENRNKFLNLVENLRCIKTSVLFSNQDIEHSEHFLLILRQINLRNHLIIKSKLDGNCFYNAISTCLFGNEEYFLLIKLGAIFIMLENERLFRIIILDHNYDESFEKIVCDSFSENSWAMMLNFYAASILINRPIISLNLNHVTFEVYILKYLYRDSLLEPVLIAFYLNHFCPILCIEKQKFDFKTKIEQNDVFIKYRN